MVLLCNIYFVRTGNSVPVADKLAVRVKIPKVCQADGVVVEAYFVVYKTKN